MEIDCLEPENNQTKFIKNILIISVGKNGNISSKKLKKNIIDSHLSCFHTADSRPSPNDELCVQQSL